MAEKLLTELSFASLLVYSPHGSAEVSRTSQRVRDKIKTADALHLQHAAMRVGEVFDASSFGEFLGRDVALVPTPGSSPRYKDGLWVPERIARTLVDAGFGSDVCPILRRTEAVPKSAFAARGERPSVAKHLATMAVDSVLLPSGKITLVDDFVTKGRTLFAAASVLCQTFPGAEIRAFALVRTMGLIPDIERILDPCSGTITLNSPGTDVKRTP